MLIRRCSIALLFGTLFLSGCATQTTAPTSVAPVVDAWYQKGAASNFYIVRSDDTIYSIAFAFGLDYRALADANHLSPPYAIHPGQRLEMTHIPAGQYHRAPVMIQAPITHEATKSYQSSSSPQPVMEPVREITPTSQLQSALHYESVNWGRGWHWPVRGRLLQAFSRRPDGHPGISIGGHLGEPVRAASSGTVVYSGDGVRGYGNLIIIKHNESYLSAYAFNQRNLVVVGDHIRAGTVIARMGQNDAGRTLLYFEIRRNGVPMNPLQYLK